ncbi:MAG: hypothetical protein ACRDIY_11490 [Chloroflexota bacterium]
MIQGAASARSGTDASPAAWVQQHPGILFLFLASLAGLIVLPTIAGALTSSDVKIGGQISLIDLVWLVVAVVLCAICLGARASMNQDLGEGLRRLIARLQTSGAEDDAPRAGLATVDLPGLGAAIVRGIFDLVVLLVIQGIVRVPLVGVAAAFQPKALVDGAFVTLVVVIALVQLYGLYRVVEPLTLRLVTIGLDRLVPTAGFSAGTLADAPAPRTLTAASGSARTARGVDQPAVAASPRSDLPTVAAGATVAGPAEATVMAPPESAADPAGATVLAATETAPLADGQTQADDSTMLSPGSDRSTEPDTRDGSAGRS